MKTTRHRANGSDPRYSFKENKHAADLARPAGPVKSFFFSSMLTKDEEDLKSSKEVIDFLNGHHKDGKCRRRITSSSDEG